MKPDNQKGTLMEALVTSFDIIPRKDRKKKGWQHDEKETTSNVKEGYRIWNIKHKIKEQLQAGKKGMAQ